MTLIVKNVPVRIFLISHAGLAEHGSVLQGALI